MKRKIAMIQPYFGTLPNYFGLALSSYESNADFDWYILTDDRTPHRYPPNVIVSYTTLAQLKSRFQQHFDFPIALERPYKLCDYKPLYGHLFADQLGDYDFWGYFDPDVIFGDLNRFITAEACQRYDKFCLKGHFSLYRNTPAVNLLYQQKVANCLYYKEVIGSERNWGFGERDYGVNAFFAARNLKVYTECPIADIYYRDYAMRVIDGTATEREKSRKSCFAYEQGKVYRYYWLADEIRREEFMYIHLMKRKMTVLCSNPHAYLIYGNAFQEAEPITRDLLESTNQDRIFYRPLDKLRFVVRYYLVPACKILFVERNYRKFVAKLGEISRARQRRLRKT